MNTSLHTILGIESSCDETAAAIVREDGEILANIVWSQMAQHAPYGGVVPEIASRAHVAMMDKVIAQACEQANMSLQQVGAIAATTGPGLIGGLMVGLMTGKALASVLQKPFVAVNHLEGHALTVRLTNKVEFPYLLLLVSGGHCQVLLTRGVGDYIRFGGTMDDAVGEAFDKTAKLMGLPYPGGPAIEKRAREGDPRRFKLPLSMVGAEHGDFSFSGLKTAVLRLVDSHRPLDEKTTADICASFQYTVGEILADRMMHAFKRCEAMGLKNLPLVVAGGVAANQFLRGRLAQVAKDFGAELVAPPIALCTDNAAMIAWAGMERWRLNGWGQCDVLDTEPRARWPLAA